MLGTSPRAQGTNVNRIMIMKTFRLKATIGLAVVGACLVTQPAAQQSGTQALQTSGQISNTFVLNLSGFDARDTAGVPPGRLEAIVVGPTGLIEMGILGVGNRLVPVPWPLVTMTTDPRATRPGQNTLLTVNADHARLLQAPGFDRNRWLAGYHATDLVP